MTGPYARAAGNYTRYGDVFDLLRASDDRFVVFGSGEGLKLDFDPQQLPTLASGMGSRLFLLCRRLRKDLDFYAAHAFYRRAAAAAFAAGLSVSRGPRLSGRCGTSGLPVGVQHADRVRNACRRACGISILRPTEAARFVLRHRHSRALFAIASQSSNW